MKKYILFLVLFVIGVLCFTYVKPYVVSINPSAIMTIEQDDWGFIKNKSVADWEDTQKVKEIFNGKDISHSNWWRLNGSFIRIHMDGVTYLIQTNYDGYNKEIILKNSKECFYVSEEELSQLIEIFKKYNVHYE